jgi:plastocyanin
VKTIETPKLEPKKYKVKIIRDRFEPSHLKIIKGSTVEWSLEDPSTEGNQNSLYHNQKRMHIVSFDAIPEESEPFRSGKDTFKLRFFNEGTFDYRCAI